MYNLKIGNNTAKFCHKLKKRASNVFPWTAIMGKEKAFRVTLKYTRFRRKAVHSFEDIFLEKSVASIFRV